jgi:hypothetical protein
MVVLHSSARLGYSVSFPVPPHSFCLFQPHLDAFSDMCLVLQPFLHLNLDFAVDIVNLYMFLCAEELDGFFWCTVYM